MKTSTKSIPNLHPKFFWEFRFDEINWQGAYKMVIGRIVERGSQDEIDEIIRFMVMKK